MIDIQWIFSLCPLPTQYRVEAYAEVYFELEVTGIRLLVTS